MLTRGKERGGGKSDELREGGGASGRDARAQSIKERSMGGALENEGRPSTRVQRGKRRSRKRRKGTKGGRETKAMRTTSGR